MHVVESTDGPTPVQTQRAPLHTASENGCTDAVQVLVDSKADMEARDEVAMWSVQPGARHILVVVMMHLRLGQRRGIQLGHATRGDSRQGI